MATNTTKTSAAAPKAPRTRAPKADSVVEVSPVAAEPTVQKTADDIVIDKIVLPPPVPAAPLDPTSYVAVRSGFNGRLVYRSKKTGEVYVWKEFGQEHDMELQELKSARNTSREFFSNNWFMLDDPAVIKWLGVQEYYRNSLSMDDFDALFKKRPEEIERIVASLPVGQRDTVANRARELIANEDPMLDSIRVIRALERSLGVKLDK